MPMILLTILVIAPAVIGILVFSHELGHYLAARSVGVQVLTFSVGFGPKFLRIRRGETEYALSWIPFGGYVKMAGEMEGDNEEGQNIRPGARFSDKSVLARMWVVIAGPVANYVLALLIFIGYFAFAGEDVITGRTIAEITPSSPAASAGLQADDEIVSVAGHAIEDWSDYARVMSALPAGSTEIVYRRAGAEHTMRVDLGPLKTGEDRLGVYPLRPAVVGTVKRGAPAARAGIQNGDLITTVDGKPVKSWDALADVIHDSAGKALAFEWSRGGRAMSGTVTPESGTIQVGENETRKAGLIGIAPHMDRKPLTAVAAAGEGWRQVNWWCGQVAQFPVKLIERKVSRDQIGGPLRIGQLAGESYRWGIASLVSFLAILSVHLAVLNLIPIPIFDGGQLVLLTAEGLMRRPLNQRLRLVLQQVGFGLVVLLMAVVTLLDVGRWIGR